MYAVIKTGGKQYRVTEGETLKVEKLDVNSWQIGGAKNLAKVSYLVNDTYDVEGTHDIFSPAGTNKLSTFSSSPISC